MDLLPTEGTLFLLSQWLIFVVIPHVFVHAVVVKHVIPVALKLHDLVPDTKGLEAYGTVPGLTEHELRVGKVRHQIHYHPVAETGVYCDSFSTGAMHLSY